jgi:hypothetical protein
MILIPNPRVFSVTPAILPANHPIFIESRTEEARGD